MDRLVVGPRTEQLVARLAGHAVAQRDHVLTADVDVRHVEELEVRRASAPIALLEDLHRVRALELEAIVLALAVGAQRGALVALDGHVPLAAVGLGYWAWNSTHSIAGARPTRLNSFSAR